MAPASNRRDRSGPTTIAETGPLAAMRDAAALLRRGRPGEAVAAYRRIVKAHPDHPEAHHNLGVALRADGRDEEAIAAYRRAIELRPTYAAANHHLGQALDAVGRPMDALKHHFLAYRLARDRVDFAQALAVALRPVRLKSASPAVVEALTALFKAQDIDHQDLMAVTAGLILARDGVAALAAAAARPWTEAVSDGIGEWWRGPGGRALADDKLFHALLRQTIVADERTELAVGALRRLLLDEQTKTGAIGDREVAASIACQGFATDYALAETAQEMEAVEALRRQIEKGERQLPSTAGDLLLTLAMYGKLSASKGAAELADRLRGQNDALDLVARRQIDEPAQERDLAAGVPSLTAIEDGTSRAVQRQYEENPYPRWQSMLRRPARKLDEVVSELFPSVASASIPPAPHRVLVAGCGTGRHALAVAFRYAETDILAVDLSRASLGFAMRRTRELGVDNIRYRQADILKLGGIGASGEERFDVIESSGVLHHLADPEAGLRVLVDLLKPGGFLKLGLYSTLGRQAIAQARRFVADRGFDASPRGIRAARQAIRGLPPQDPVRRIAEELDFASISACRDLLFHVQERSYTLPEIDRAVRGLGLEFLGFEVADDATRAAYARLFPEDRARNDLDRWRRLEEQRPQTFRTMYQFWCRKP